jgi:glycosyltransferase involved in cell wall biosynthesis
MGYAADKMVVIPNGFDLDLFRPQKTARLSVRQEFGIPDNTLLIGLVGRYNRQKDYGNFVEAAAMLHRQIPTTHFLLCGDGVNWENNLLAQRIDAAGLRSYSHLLGRRQDIPWLVAALDIACSSSSFGEGFPNVIGEAMACGVPCVVTDVGDSALIVGDTGKVVLPRDPAALASAWRDLIDQGETMRLRLGEAARSRIKKNFDLQSIARRYENLYREMAL